MLTTNAQGQAITINTAALDSHLCQSYTSIQPAKEANSGNRIMEAAISMANMVYTPENLRINNSVGDFRSLAFCTISRMRDMVLSPNGLVVRTRTSASAA